MVSSNFGSAGCDAGENPQLLIFGQTYDLLEGEIERVNREVPEKLRIRCCLVLPKEFDADDEELTRTRKVRRQSIYQRYGGLVEAMFGGAREVESTITFRYEDGSEQVLKVPIRIRDVAAG